MVKERSLRKFTTSLSLYSVAICLLPEPIFFFNFPVRYIQHMPQSGSSKCCSKGKLDITCNLKLMRISLFCPKLPTGYIIYIKSPGDKEHFFVSVLNGRNVCLYNLFCGTV